MSNMTRASLSIKLGCSSMVCSPDVGETPGSTPAEKGEVCTMCVGYRVFNSSTWEMKAEDQEVKFILNYKTSLKLDYVRY